MVKERERVSDVFKTIGQPTITYVKRDDGKLEKRLNDALNEKGQLCLLTGPSKTGKTTLYREVLSAKSQIPLIVQCDRSKTSDAIWRQALEAVDFDRIETTSSGKVIKLAADGEASTQIGWSWLANATSRLKGTLARETSETEARKKVLSEPGPDLLIPLLRSTNLVLVIEDFHYLQDVEKTLLFQQWKRFIDNEVPVLVLGTTHRAVDIANSNRDLVGRIAQIDVGHWSSSDLEKICDSGVKHLRCRLPATLRGFIASEAVGLPIVAQQICLEIFNARGIEYVDQARRNPVDVSRPDLEQALHSVARQKYTQFETYYTTLIRGPREKARKYRTYELVLACFTLDPIKFALRRSELDERLLKLDLTHGEKPPPASLNSTLGALKKFQEKRGFDLLEWRPTEEILYIIEPSFLFYVRWRTLRETAPTQLDLFEQLIARTWAQGAATDPAVKSSNLSIWVSSLMPGARRKGTD